MNFFENSKNVEEYIKIAEGYDGSEFIPILRKYLADGSSLLELGMGPGKDLDLLGEYFKATGSDSSHVFLKRYKDSHPDAGLLLLDAVTIQTNRKFDCIYSNKVLIHLTKEDLRSSFQRQYDVLNIGGIAFHTFWLGEGEEEFHGLRFLYLTPEKITPIVDERFEITSSTIYTESEKNDSFFIILRKTKN